MNFLYGEYLIIILVILAAFIYGNMRINKKFYSWVEDHWFFKQTYKNKIAALLNLVGISLLALSLLDLRGPEKKIEGKVSKQRTIILVDSSSSMLAEDVRPNRFRKALLLVKHYVKKAVGQEISLVVFSDGQKRIVPFTNDYDLIDARINTLETLQLDRGGTGLSLAIKESLQYFRSNSGELTGNILIFTDAEETESVIDMEIPESITVGIVGVGTSKGAPIPIRNRRGVSVGNKKHNGKTVVTKLDESFMEKLKDQIKNYKYWIATSYSLPTEEIISFFSKSHTLKESKNTVQIKPVLANLLIVPGVILLGLSYVLMQFRTFVSLSVFLFISLQGGAYAEEDRKEPVKTELTLSLEEKFLKNKISDHEKSELAQNLFVDGFSKSSENLYEEILDKDITNENKIDHFNHSSALLQNGKIKEAAEKLKQLLKKTESGEIKTSPEFYDAVKKNLVKALRSSGGGKGSKSKSDKKEKDDKEKENKSGKGDSSDKKDKKDDKKKKSEKDKKDDKNKKDEKDKENSKNEDDKKKEEKNKNGQPKNKFNKKKLPALLKQLISDDNKLQKKMIDAKTKQRKSRDKKDW